MISTQQHVEDSTSTPVGDAAMHRPARGAIPEAGLDFDAPGFRANPFPVLARLRESGPIHAMTLPNGTPAWLVTRFEDASRVLQDARCSTVPPPDHLPVWRSPAIMRLSEPSMLSVDLLDHKRLRGLVSRAFTPRFIEGLRPRIQDIADALIDAVLARGQMEFIDDFAFPLPITVIGEMLGIPVEDRPRLRAWSALLVNAISMHEDAETEARADEFGDYLDALIESKRRDLRDDLISQLIHAEEAGSRLSLQEVRAMIVLLIVAGHETTVNLLGNGLVALFTHPAQLDALRRDIALVPAAVEELLRFCGPALTPTVRYALEDMEIAGTHIPRGEVLVVSLASADRDAAQFRNPEALDITRPSSKHLAFGYGVHFCLGAPLARLEAQVALTTLLRRLSALRLNTTPDAVRWRGNMLLRGVHALPVAF
jgi:cytochrome P450